jgi:transketolase
MALAAKMDEASWQVYSIHGDGELQEGSIWEAAMAASHHHLDNLTAIVDRNKLQIDGRNSDVMEIEPLKEKWEAFGWNVISCNGNDIPEILKALKTSRNTKNKPSVIIAETIMGKGVKSIENDYHWHGKVPLKSEVEDFINQIELSI